MSKSEELDLELIKDKTVDAMLMMQLIAKNRLMISAIIKSKNEALERKNNATSWSQRKISMIWPGGQIEGRW